MKSILRLGLFFALVASAGTAWSVPGPIDRGYRLPVARINGKAYYRTYRVTTPRGLERITSTNPGRFFGGGGQYGEAFYLFRTLGAAKKFIRCERTRGVKREVIAEVLLPKARFDAVEKGLVPPSADWGLAYSPPNPRHDQMRDLYLSKHILFGKWTQSPHPFYQEPAYSPMIGTKQLAIRQLGDPSILNEAVIRLLP